MQARRGGIAIALATALALAGCAGSGTPRLMNIQAKAGHPDEFAILPTKPLAMPKTAALPAPTPGGTNRADPTPVADAVAALGGRASTLKAQGIPRSDAALVAAASRYGVQSGIRQSLARADLTFRREHPGKPLDRLFGQNLYFGAYAPMTLDAYAELARWRRAGVRTPSAPPGPAAR